MGQQDCGLCRGTFDEQDVARGRRLSICRACVTAGVAATLEGAAGSIEGATPRSYLPCAMCGDQTPPSSLFAPGGLDEAAVCATCIRESYASLSRLVDLARNRYAHFPDGSDRSSRELLAAHFPSGGDADIVTTSRTYPKYLRVDLQRALERAFEADVRCVGLHLQHQYETITYSTLVRNREAPKVGPLQYTEVDIGDGETVRCLVTALWLPTWEQAACAVLLSEVMSYGQSDGWRVELCIPVGEQGEVLARRFFAKLDGVIQAARTYRGKVLSFEKDRSPHGGDSQLAVHALREVSRDDIILPGPTLDLLDRSVFGFVRHRARLRELGLSTKKGLLFYGPPGTGKTHTIHYLARALADHTTFLITAAQVAHLSTYMTMARLLAPSIVVIEDVDLIGRERSEMRAPAEEATLNQLLNEMDGLKDSADILFVLTTNAPEMLEPALAARPGRVDQAIEFPLPNEAGRARLIDLYRGGLDLSADLVATTVERTEGVSAAFIKELMRRVAQSVAERGRDSTSVEAADIEQALREMLYEGGSLNASLLGVQGNGEPPRS